MACSMVVEVENSDAVLTSFAAGRSRRMGSREPMSRSGEARSVEKTELLIHAGPWESEKVTMVSAPAGCCELIWRHAFKLVHPVFFRYTLRRGREASPCASASASKRERPTAQRCRRQDTTRSAKELGLHPMAKRTRDDAYAPDSPRDEAGAWSMGGAGSGDARSMVTDTGAVAAGVYDHHGGEVEQLKSRASVKRVKRRVVSYVQTLLTRFFAAGRPPAPMDEEDS